MVSTDGTVIYNDIYKKGREVVRTYAMCNTEQ